MPGCRCTGKSELVTSDTVSGSGSSLLHGVLVIAKVRGIACCVWFRLFSACDGKWGEGSVIYCGVQYHHVEMQHSDTLLVFDREVYATEMGPSSPAKMVAFSVRVVLENSLHRTANKTFRTILLQKRHPGLHVGKPRRQPIPVYLEAMPSDQIRTTNCLKSRTEKL